MEPIIISLAEARRIYEEHFQRELPPKLPYAAAAGQVLVAIGERRFRRRLTMARLFLADQRKADGLPPISSQEVIQ